MDMTSSFLMLVISLISLWEGKDQIPWGPPSLPQVPVARGVKKPGNKRSRHAPPGRQGQAHLMVICGLSPLSDFNPIKISRMVWDQ